MTTHAHGRHTHIYIQFAGRESRRQNGNPSTRPANRPVYRSPSPLILYKFSHDFSGFSRHRERTSRRQTHASRPPPPVCILPAAAAAAARTRVKKNRKSTFHILYYYFIIHTQRVSRPESIVYTPLSNISTRILKKKHTHTHGANETIR